MSHNEMASPNYNEIYGETQPTNLSNENTEHLVYQQEATYRQLRDAEKTLQNKNVLINLLRGQIQQMELNLKIMMNEKEEMRCKYCCLEQDYLGTKNINKEREEEISKLKMELSRKVQVEVGNQHGIDELLSDQKKVLEELLTCIAKERTPPISTVSLTPNDVGLQPLGSNIMTLEGVLKEYVEIIKKLENEIDVLGATLKKVNTESKGDHKINSVNQIGNESALENEEMKKEICLLKTQLRLTEEELNTVSRTELEYKNLIENQKNKISQLQSELKNSEDIIFENKTLINTLQTEIGDLQKLKCEVCMLKTKVRLTEETVKEKEIIINDLSSAKQNPENLSIIEPLQKLLEEECTYLEDLLYQEFNDKFEAENENYNSAFEVMLGLSKQNMGLIINIHEHIISYKNEHLTIFGNCKELLYDENNYLEGILTEYTIDNLDEEFDSTMYNNEILLLAKRNKNLIMNMHKMYAEEKEQQVNELINLNNELQESISEKDSKLEQMEVCLCNYRGELNVVEFENSYVKNMLTEIKQECTCGESQIINCNNEIKEQLQKIVEKQNELEKILKYMRCENETVVQEIKSSKSTLSTIRMDNSDVKINLKEISSCLCEYEGELNVVQKNGLSDRVTELSKRYSDCLKHLEVVQAENNDIFHKLQVSLKDLKRNIEEEAARKDESERLIKEAINQKEVLEEELKKNYDNICLCNMNLKDVLIDYDKTKSKLNSTQQEQNILKEKLAKSTEEIKRLKEECCNLKNVIKKEQEHSETDSTKQNIMNSKLFNIKTMKYEFALNEIKSLESINENFLVVLEQKLIMDRQNLQGLVADTLDHVQQLRLDLHILTQEINTMDLIFKALENNCQESASKDTPQPKEKIMVESTCVCTEELYLDKILKQIDRLEEENAQLISERDNQLAEFLANNVVLQTEITNNLEQIQEYQRIILELQKEKEDIKETMSRISETCQRMDKHAHETSETEEVTVRYTGLMKLYQEQENWYRERLQQKELAYNKKIQEMDELVDKFCMLCPDIDQQVKMKMNDECGCKIEEADIESWKDRKAKILNEVLTATIKSSNKLINEKDNDIRKKIGSGNFKSVIDDFLLALEDIKASETDKKYIKSLIQIDNFDINEKNVEKPIQTNKITQVPVILEANKLPVISVTPEKQVSALNITIHKSADEVAKISTNQENILSNHNKNIEISFSKQQPSATKILTYDEIMKCSRNCKCKMTSDESNGHAKHACAFKSKLPRRKPLKPLSRCARCNQTSGTSLLETIILEEDDQES